MCHLIFTYFPECYQTVTTRNRQVRTQTPIKTGQSAKPHGQWNRDSDPEQLSWQRQQAILIIIVTSLPLLNVKNKPHTHVILFTLSFFPARQRAKQIHLTLTPLKILESNLCHVMWPDTPQNPRVCNPINPKLYYLWIERKVTACKGQPEHTERGPYKTGVESKHMGVSANAPLDSLL